LVKNFPLTVKGRLGFDYAQVTKGGVLLSEVDKNLQSKKIKGLYFAGEILDADGECGGFNLQWAYSSARAVATALDRE
ncbi:MAG: NAD(P)/FAD-dependent oxidoreductase, partial [Clostridia bacterium]|nr:NAD(P)/FAD-dependent oxidoreductase [Clostridia bacterium]